ncbi:SAM and SH3 domain-containing protein 1-like isoform X1 [Euwallacea fornicatus]|uniref:SAM and SH3 domain-containing protein 1-like isoform X1 n=2 Tax=Euwallacea fornicatus TaxID=995702 RepID=UPI00338DB816
MASNIVTEWLKSLRLGQYSESFIDNGYDDLEICKQIGDPDLDAIGVFNPTHRARLLQSVRTLREEGAASVYFSLEEAEEAAAAADSQQLNSSDIDRHSVNSGSDKNPSAPQEEVSRYLDEYEEGKAELVKIPRVQLKTLLKEKLSQDGVTLSLQPYSNQDGERGYLEGLASRYADLFSTHYGDVFAHLEDLRKTEVSEISTSSIVPGMTTSLSQPIYAPGKYLPSSCLSHKDEDEIYGFVGAQVKPNQIAIPQQPPRIVGSQMTQPLLSQQQHNYQTCLSPRSAYFYEFPPNEQGYANTTKKKNTFSRIQRIFKTSHRKEKHGASSPRHGRATTIKGVPQRVDTPDSVLQSGLGLTDLGQHAVIRSMVDPLDYDRLRHLQMNGGAPTSFEETIYKLKVQEALRKREKFTKEHEEILRDIKQGLLQLGKEGIRGPMTATDDTYMYDDDVRMLAPSTGSHPHDPRLGHWYDEPPYESDPEDFLMGGGGQATIQNGRVCFTLNVRPEQKNGEGVISLRSAGDISLSTGHCQTPRRGLILPREAGYPPTIIPLRSSKERESGDYASSDVQSVSSRLSTLSMDTSRSELFEMTSIISPQYYTPLESNKSRQFRRSHNYPRSEDGLSPSQSSDYEDQEEFSNCSQQQVATVHVSSDGRSSGVSSLVGKVRGLREDVQRKISRLKGEEQSHNHHEQTLTFSASSVESLPSGSGSSTQALVRAGSNHSSISTDEVEPSEQIIIGRAKALVDQNPSPYDKETLKFKAGDVIDIVSMNPSGQWKGVSHGKKGTFKFKNVELLTVKKKDQKWIRTFKGRPVSVEDLLQKIGLAEYISVFIVNGYEDLELFKEIEPSDMDYLGIVNGEHRAKILTAVQLLHELDSGSDPDIAGSSSENDDQRNRRTPFNRRHLSRDSGCYDSHKRAHASPQSDASDHGDKNNLDSVVEQCNNEILARVRQAQQNQINLKGEVVYDLNIPVLERRAKDSYVSMHGQTSLLDPSKRGVQIRKRSDEFCESDQKFSVKYVANSEISEQVQLNIISKSCLSEKSSDSGVSSSSLSSTLKERDNRPIGGFQHLERSNNCANTSITANKRT